MAGVMEGGAWRTPMCMELLMKTESVLFVDDEQSVLAGLRRNLKPYMSGWDMAFASSAAEALELCRRRAFDVVVTDARMPEMGGVALIDSLRDNPKTQDTPVIVLTGCAETELRLEALQHGAVEFLNKPVTPEELFLRIRNLMQFKNAAATEGPVAAALSRRNEELAAARRELVTRFSRAIELKDMESDGHIARVSLYAGILARALDLPQPDVELIEQASALHDIGKLGIPDTILLKQGPLDWREWNVMKRHAVDGAQMLEPDTDSWVAYRHHTLLGEALFGDSDEPLLRMAANIAAYHHEHWDGSGYPCGLSGEEIPLAARIVALADVYDALRNSRPYRPAYSSEEARAIIADLSGTQLDPQVVGALFRSLESIEAVRLGNAVAR